MKKVFSVILVFLFVISASVLSGCGETESDFSVTAETAAIDYSAYAGTTINVYNWGEYISDGTEGTVDVNEEFTRLTGIKVNYTNYASVEDMYSKIAQNTSSYDIIIPSDYMVQRLISEGLVQKIDFSNIPNYKYIDPLFKDLYFDPNNEYSVPYNAGMLGVIYNTELCKDIEITESWDLLWNEKLTDNILMINNPRDAFGVAEYYLGFNCSTESSEELQKAQELLINQKQYVKAYVMDEVFNKMESGSAAVATYYAGDFLSMYENNENLAFYYPKEGTNIFVDSICIPTSSKNKEAAELYINFLCDPNVAICNAEKLYYRSPNIAVAESEEYRQFLANIHEDAYEIIYPDWDSLYPNTDVNDYYYHSLSSEGIAKMEELWSEMKITTTENSDSSMLIWICAAFAAAIVVMIVFFKVRKIKREREADEED